MYAYNSRKKFFCSPYCFKLASFVVELLDLEFFLVELKKIKFAFEMLLAHDVEVMPHPICSSNFHKMPEGSS